MSIDRVRAKASEYGYNLAIRVRLRSEGKDGAARTQEALALELGKPGACVVVDEPLTIGTMVELSSKRFLFEKRASVHSIYRDRRTGVYILGLELFDGAWDPFTGGDCETECE